MLRASIGGIALAALLAAACSAASAHDASKFPDWSGQWTRTYTGNPRYDQTKPLRKQEAPLKPEYQARSRPASRIRTSAVMGSTRPTAACRRACRG